MRWESPVAVLRTGYAKDAHMELRLIVGFGLLAFMIVGYGSYISYRIMRRRSEEKTRWGHKPRQK